MMPWPESIHMNICEHQVGTSGCWMQCIEKPGRLNPEGRSFSAEASANPAGLRGGLLRPGCAGREK